VVHVKPKREEIIEDGWYPATIGDVEERETKFGDKLLFPFEVDAGETGVVAIDAWLTLSDHPKANLVKWGKQLFGDREFDTDEFTDKTVEVFVEEGENNDGEPKNFVRKLRPLSTEEEAPTKKSKGKKEEVEIDESDFDDIPF
jgi:hypothetical protein